MENIIYTKTDCLQCVASKVTMDDNGTKYREVSLEENPSELARLKAKGYLAAPIIETPTDTWTGFNYEKLMAMK